MKLVTVRAKWNRLYAVRKAHSHWETTNTKTILTLKQHYIQYFVVGCRLEWSALFLSIVFASKCAQQMWTDLWRLCKVTCTKVIDKHQVQPLIPCKTYHNVLCLFLLINIMHKNYRTLPPWLFAKKETMKLGLLSFSFIASMAGILLLDLVDHATTLCQNWSIVTLPIEGLWESEIGEHQNKRGAMVNM